MRVSENKTKCARCGKWHEVSFREWGIGWVCLNCKCYYAGLNQIAADVRRAANTRRAA